MAKSESENTFRCQILFGKFRWKPPRHSRGHYQLSEKRIWSEVERRAIYCDIAALRDVFGMDIDGGQGGKYRLLSRQFEFEPKEIVSCQELL